MRTKSILYYYPIHALVLLMM